MVPPIDRCGLNFRRCSRLRAVIAARCKALSDIRVCKDMWLSVNRYQIVYNQTVYTYSVEAIQLPAFAVR